MKNKFAIFSVFSLLLLIVGCSKPIDESRVIGAWKFGSAWGTIMTLNTNHTFSLTGGKGDGGGLIGEWSIQGSRLTTIGHTWTNGSTAINISKINFGKISELTDTQMVWGSDSLTRVVFSNLYVFDVNKSPLWHGQFCGSRHKSAVALFSLSACAYEIILHSIFGCWLYVSS